MIVLNYGVRCSPLLVQCPYLELEIINEMRVWLQ